MANPSIWRICPATRLVQLRMGSLDMEEVDFKCDLTHGHERPHHDPRFKKPWHLRGAVFD